MCHLHANSRTPLFNPLATECPCYNLQMFLKKQRRGIKPSLDCLVLLRKNPTLHHHWFLIVLVAKLYEVVLYYCGVVRASPWLYCHSFCWSMTSSCQTLVLDKGINLGLPPKNELTLDTRFLFCSSVYTDLMTVQLCTLQIWCYPWGRQGINNKWSRLLWVDPGRD